MELELKEVNEEITVVSRQNEEVSGKSFMRSKLMLAIIARQAIVTKCRLSNQTYCLIAELQQDYLARKELETLIEETETSFQKINESIKTLICVVQKQEKSLLVKTGQK